jgi:hypothetical protein
LPCTGTLDLRLRFDQAMSELKATYSGRLSGLDLEVQLGLDHARIGLMVLQDVAATALSSDTREAYAQAWVKQMFHLEPQTQVTRWQVLADPHKLLISCVDRRVFEALTDFAREHGLRFVSCRPAVLSTIAAQQGTGKAGQMVTVVWTEAATADARSSSVQLLRFDGAQLSCAWRGWVPPAPVSDGGDETLEGAIRRFQGHTRAGDGDTVTHVHWPSAAPGAVHTQ